ncbi:putative sarcosine oxidase [Xylariaceae sp. FL0016]|nr:putative sarcosine oxidase [Xylariaceae sp. FL0016]
MPKSVLIVGGGTFGTSTAYHLSLNPSAYSRITVLDRFPVPSREAAGNDINKVVRADYPETLYARLATEAIAAWRDPKGLYAGLHHQTGWLFAANGPSDWIQESGATARRLGLEVPEALSADEIRRRWPMLGAGSFPGWSTVWNSSAGWANARAGVERQAEAAQKNGVRYVDGAAGHIRKLLFDQTGRCLGAVSADGKAYFADVVVVAAGAAAASLLDMKGQLVAKGHTVGHIQLSPAEVRTYAEMPIVSHREGGLIFPPQEDGIMKIGAMHFLTNYNGTDLSLPRYRSDRRDDGIPKPIEKILRKWMKEFLPAEVADRDFCENRICWDADTVDHHFIIGEHPGHAGLHLAVGGSGHGFKFLPIIGRYVVDMIEGQLDVDTRQKWRWRPGATSHGPNPFPTPLLELSDVPGWGKISPRL